MIGGMTTPNRGSVYAVMHSIVGKNNWFVLGKLICIDTKCMSWQRMLYHIIH